MEELQSTLLIIATISKYLYYAIGIIMLIIIGLSIYFTFIKK